MGRFSSFLYQLFFKQGFDNKGDNCCWEIGKDSPSDFPRLRVSSWDKEEKKVWKI